MTEYLTIAQIARVAGLTTEALRHYDSVGVPVEVDEENRYRFFGRDQVEQARQIRILRELEVPLDEIRRILQNPDSDEGVARIAAHRRRIGARLTELQTIFYFLGRLIERREITHAMPVRPASVSLEPNI